MFQKLEAVIYDLDGTIIDTERFHRDAWELTSQECGLGLSGEVIYQASKGISSKRTLKNILPAEREDIIARNMSVLILMIFIRLKNFLKAKFSINNQ